MLHEAARRPFQSVVLLLATSTVKVSRDDDNRLLRFGIEHDDYDAV